MSSQTSSQSHPTAPLSLLLISATALLINGCAGKPWGDPADAMKRDLALSVLDELQREETSRSSCVDADVNIFFTSHLKSRALKGYMQLMQPSLLKFVTSNPFGQPLIVFMSDSNHFSYADTTSMLFMDGELTAFANKNDIPEFVYQRPWGEWLTARLPATGEITGVRKDDDNLGTWVTYSDRQTPNSSPEVAYSDHLLIDTEKRQMIKRIYTSDSGNIEAEITYEQWSATVPGQPEKITVSGLGYGGTLKMEFLDTEARDDCRITDFNLRKPTGYQYVHIVD